MQNLILQLNCNFSDNDKETCIPTIYKITDLANLARTRGILALESEIEQSESIFLKTAVQLVVDGTDPELVKKILQNIILADKYTGSQLLDRLLMAEGTLALQQGEPPSIITLRLSAMLGEKYISQIMEKASALQQENMKKYSNFLKTLQEIEALSESLPFEAIILQLDNRSIQYIVRHIAEYTLATALYGCKREVIYRILDNLSFNTCLQFCDYWEQIKLIYKDSIMAAQEQILKVIDDFVNTGEIVTIYEK